jgi:hypothetical protein
VVRHSPLLEQVGQCPKVISGKRIEPATINAHSLWRVMIGWFLLSFFFPGNLGAGLITFPTIFVTFAVGFVSFAAGFVTFAESQRLGP